VAIDPVPQPGQELLSWLGPEPGVDFHGQVRGRGDDAEQHDRKAGHARQLMAYTALFLGAYLAISGLVVLTWPRRPTPGGGRHQHLGPVPGAPPST
jgi:hypothetical protein